MVKNLLSNAGGSILGLGTKILQAAQHGKKPEHSSMIKSLKKVGTEDT